MEWDYILIFLNQD